MQASQLQLSWERNQSLSAIAAYFLFAVSCCDLAKHENKRVSSGGCLLGWVPTRVGAQLSAQGSRGQPAAPLWAGVLQPGESERRDKCFAANLIF